MGTKPPAERERAEQIARVRGRLASIQGCGVTKTCEVCARMLRFVREDIETLLSALPPVRETAAVNMGKGWRVEVSRCGEDVIAIEGEMLAGKPDITEEDRQLIVGCAQQLLAFAGDGKSTFLPDDDPQPEVRETAAAEPTASAPRPDARVQAVIDKMTAQLEDGCQKHGQNWCCGCDVLEKYRKLLSAAPSSAATKGQ